MNNLRKTERRDEEWIDNKKQPRWRSKESKLWTIILAPIHSSPYLIEPKPIKQRKVKRANEISSINNRTLKELESGN